MPRTPSPARTRIERALATSTVLMGYALWVALAASLGWALARLLT